MERATPRSIQAVTGPVMGRCSTMAKLPDPPLSRVLNMGQGYSPGSGAWSHGLISTGGILIMCNV